MDLGDKNENIRTPQMQLSYDGRIMMNNPALGGKSANLTSKKKASHLRASSSVNNDYTNIAGPQSTTDVSSRNNQEHSAKSLDGRE